MIFNVCDGDDCVIVLLILHVFQVDWLKSFCWICGLSCTQYFFIVGKKYFIVFIVRSNAFDGTIIAYNLCFHQLSVCSVVPRLSELTHDDIKLVGNILQCVTDTKLFQFNHRQSSRVEFKFFFYSCMIT